MTWNAAIVRPAVAMALAAAGFPGFTSAQVAWQDYRVQAVEARVQPVLDGYLEQEVWGRGGD